MLGDNEVIHSPKWITVPAASVQMNILEEFKRPKVQKDHIVLELDQQFDESLFKRCCRYLRYPNDESVTYGHSYI